MNSVVFYNTGEIDLRSFKTFGISAKTGSNPIGYFGTGLKYAIAILLREGHSVDLYSGKKKISFGLKEIDMRGKGFQIVTANGDELPFTTELGKNWELWQAFRELYCNAIDEMGGVSLRAPFEVEVMPIEGTTLIVVNGTEFENLYQERDRIVLKVDESLRLESSSKNVEVFNRKSGSIYYRGIKVSDLEVPSMLTYNIKAPIELTEDRTAKHDFVVKTKLPIAVSSLVDKTIIKRTLVANPELFYEGRMNFDVLEWNKEYLTKEFVESINEEFERNNDKLNPTARAFWAKTTQSFNQKNYQLSEMTRVEKAQLEKCTGIISQLFNGFDDFDILVVKTLGQSTMALADTDKNAIVVSKLCFEKGTKYLLSTLIEEYAHLKTGYRDHSRELQTWLFDQICSLIEDHVLKEPV